MFLRFPPVDLKKLTLSILYYINIIIKHPNRAKKDTNDKDKLVQLESKVRELESNLELEKMQASRHEVMT